MSKAPKPTPLDLAFTAWRASGAGPTPEEGIFAAGWDAAHLELGAKGVLAPKTKGKKRDYTYKAVPGSLRGYNYPDAMAILIPQYERNGWEFVGFINDSNFMVRKRI